MQPTLAMPRNHPPPSGQKINVRVGQKVILNVTTDTDDEIDAHIGGPDYELPVQAGKPAKGPSPSTLRAASRLSLTILRRSHRDLERALVRPQVVLGLLAAVIVA
jgi:hypothetical protein